MRYLLALTAICTMTAALLAGPAGKPAGWGPLEALVGDWTGEGGGQPGQGTGSFSFQPGRWQIKFEIAPPGHPKEFATYIEAGARRVSQ
jgi:hypothetical protein